MTSTVKGIGEKVAALGAWKFGKRPVLGTPDGGLLWRESQWKIALRRLISASLRN